ncbi:hypothetical protein E5D57_005815 [Metarhizium anisopliae]|nr:hypothetical protein E5D57_005815 [Metarhizium anisopliae]
MTDDKALSLTHAEKERIVKGSKADMAGWCLYITLIWCLKACMLFFYRRLTLETRQRRLVIIAAVACVFSYMATIGVVLLRCLPFHKNWQIYPYPGGNWSMGFGSRPFVGIISVNAPILGPWIIRKCTNMVHSISSKDRSESDVGNRGVSIVTIGRQNHRLERRNWGGQKHEPPGWTTINDSEEYIMDNPVQQHNSNGAPSSHATSLAAFQQV